MKSKTTIFLILFSFTLFACKKNPGDYRNKYWGNYDFQYNCFELDNGGQIGGITHTGTSIGKIYYDKNDAENTLLIKMDTNSAPIRFEIMENIGITGCGSAGYIDNPQNILFGFDTYTCPIDGLLDSTIYQVTGQKR